MEGPGEVQDQEAHDQSIDSVIFSHFSFHDEGRSKTAEMTVPIN